MTTTIDLSWTEPAYAGGGVYITATLTPTPTAGANVWIFVDGVSSGQLPADSNGQVRTYFGELTLGSHVVEGGFATLAANPDDPIDSDSIVSPNPLIVVAPPPGSSPASVPPTSTTDSSQSGIQNLAFPAVGDRVQNGPSPFSGASDVDPYTGAGRSDPYTGEPLSARDAAIGDRIRAIYSQPDAVADTTRNAFFDFYRSPSIDLTDVPQSVQNSIFEVFGRAAEPPLPGRGLDEFLGDVFSTALGDLSGGFRSAFGQGSLALGVVADADSVALAATFQTVRPILGAVQAAGALGEIVSGVAISIGSEGLAAGAGLALAAHGVDQLIAGIRTMFGEEAQSLTQYILTDAGKQAFGPNAALVAGVADGLLSFGLGSAATLMSDVGGLGRASLSGLTTEGAIPRIELSESSQIGQLSLGDASGIKFAEQPEIIRFPASSEASLLKGEDVAPGVPSASPSVAVPRTEASVLFQARDNAIETARLIVQQELDTGRIGSGMAEARFGTWLDALAKNNIRQAVEEGLLPDTFVTSPTVAINRGYLRPWIKAPDVWDTATGRAWDFMAGNEKAFYQHENSYVGATAVGRLDPSGTTIIEIFPLFHSGFQQ